MKKTLIYLFLALALISCNSNKNKEISQAEFNRLFLSDSVSSICIMDNGPIAVYKKTNHKKGKHYFLNIDSNKAFEKTLKTLEKTAALKNSKQLSYSLSYVSGNTIPEYFIFSFFEILFSLGLLLLFLYAIIDILRNNFESDTNKLIWILVVIFIPLIGPILYIFIGRKQKLKNSK